MFWFLCDFIIIEDSEVWLECLVGNNWINLYVKVLVDLFWCNYDCCVLVGFVVSWIVWYVVKYIVKE